MNLTTHEIGLEALDALKGVDALCLFISEDARPLPGLAGFADWRLCGRLSRVLRDRFFTGALGESLLLPSNGRLAMPRIFAIGTGQLAQFSASALADTLANAARMLTRAKMESAAIDVPGQGSLDDASRADAVRRSFLPQFRGARVAVIAERGLRSLLFDSR
ncbi:MAG: peptidase M17 [Myxococcales bacterium]|nr:peptidase M17 [Myxococcales bacterium]